MELDKLILDIVMKLETRRNVPNYVIFSGIEPRTLLRTRQVLKDVPHSEEVDIILHSGGGDPGDAYRLIRTFRERYTTVNIIVPFWAKSEATLLAFGGSRIVLHEFGELGPLNAQIRI